MAQGPCLSLKYTAGGWDKEEDQNIRGLVQVSDIQRQMDNFWNKSLGCHDDCCNRETLFRTREMMHANVFFIHFSKNAGQKGVGLICIPS